MLHKSTRIRLLLIKIQRAREKPLAFRIVVAVPAHGQTRRNPAFFRRGTIAGQRIGVELVVPDMYGEVASICAGITRQL